MSQQENSPEVVANQSLRVILILQILIAVISLFDISCSGHVSIGGLGDSFYEYLLKAYIQLGDEEALEMYNNAMDAFFNNGLVKVSNQSHLVYIAESRNGVVDDVVGHLACFAGNLTKSTQNIK